MFWFLPHQRTIWSNVTNNTTVVIGRHKIRFFFFCNLPMGLDTSLEILVPISEFLPF